MKNFLTLLFLFISFYAPCQKVPGKSWRQYKSVSHAGFSPTKLDEVKKMYQQFGSGSLLVIYDGAIVLSMGDVSRKFMDHSMRKSYVSALYGIHINKGEVKLNETLEELDVDDIQGLSATEKNATVRDLLSARSGVYHPSAYSPRGMSKHLPIRGSHEHGTFWYYNNWDFNTLSTILKKRTNQGIFDAFKNEIAEPLNFEDFDMADTYYRYEKISAHPAYLFRLSARDQARFGLLYMNEGMWKGQQIVPKDWIERSTSPISKELTNFEGRDGYGYLWWTTQIEGAKGYYASGTGGQRIAVFPSRKIVIIQSTNTYDVSNSIPGDKLNALIGLILAAQTEKADKKAGFKRFQQKQYKYPDFDMDMTRAQEYIGNYKHRFFGTLSIQFEQDEWVLKTNTGNFKLHPSSNTEFIPEDIRFPLIMKKAENTENKGKIELQTTQDKQLSSIQFYF